MNENIVEIELSDVIELGVIERETRDEFEFCIVYLLGDPNNRPPFGTPKIIGLDSKDKDDFYLKEKAYMIYMERIQPDDEEWEDGIAIAT